MAKTKAAKPILKDFDRDELQNIRERAKAMAGNVKTNVWIRAYENLASAVDCLDAMTARSQDIEE